jgi:hypothetical protein
MDPIHIQKFLKENLIENPTKKDLQLITNALAKKAFELSINEYFIFSKQTF